MKQFFVMLMSAFALFYSPLAFANYEIQVNGTYGIPLATTGTSGGILISDSDSVDLTDFTLAGEVYYKYNSQLQIGGLFLLNKVDLVDDTILGFGALARYNFDTDFRNSMFVGGGLRYIDFFGESNFAILLTGGKRFQLSEGFAYTPNATLALNIAGDIDSGIFLALNFLSFSGFLDKF